MSRNNGQLIQCLVDLGFSERESKVYLALLSKHHASAADLQKLSGIPQNKVYEIISGLVRKGYCLERKVGRKRTFEVIDPQITLVGSFQKLQQRLSESSKLKNELNALYSTAGEATEPLEYIEVLRGNDSIHHRYCQLVSGVKEEFLGFGRGPYACDTSEKSEEQDIEMEGAITRGARVRWIYKLHLPDDDWILRDIKELKQKGGFFRVAESLPLKMMIFDRITLLVAEEEMLAQSGGLAMSIIKQQTVVKAFRALFEFFWEHSLELEEWERQRVPSLSRKQSIGLV